jgi:hypothetical protein
VAHKDVYECGAREEVICFSGYYRNIVIAALSNNTSSSYAADSIADDDDMFHRLGKVNNLNNIVCQPYDKIYY